MIEILVHVYQCFLCISGEGQGKGQYKTSVHALASVIRNEGVRAVYRGYTSSHSMKQREKSPSLHIHISSLIFFFSLILNFSLGAGLLRQATYTTTRLGVFQWLSDLTTRKGKQSSFFVKVRLFSL